MIANVTDYCLASNALIKNVVAISINENKEILDSSGHNLITATFKAKNNVSLKHKSFITKEFIKLDDGT